MLQGAAIILVFQWLGELCSRLLALPVPGPVVGMALLFAALLLRGGEVPEGMRVIGEAVQRHLALLFIPAGVGLMVHYQLLGEQWLAITVALVVSTLAGLVATVVVMRWLGAERDGGSHD